jgi:crotonobetainyl-CoA:carnitine CoA-transferase CaiB-like acyl-CoA transferase
VAHARRRELAEVLAHPQLAARDRWTEVGSPVGPLRAVLPPITLPGRQPRMDRVPALGEHTAAILRELGRERSGHDAPGCDRSGHDASTPRSAPGGRPAPDQSG